MDNKKFTFFNAAIIVAALGYFVDIYDLLLFSMVRVSSINALGTFTLDEARDIGESIISWQMAGLLIGGILWGVLGDKKGRLSVLFGSILLYSICNILNGFVGQYNILSLSAIDQYKIIRLIAGIGLAGELGAGITLVSEITPKEKRGVATSLVAGIGLSGAVLAYFMKENFDWRTCYFIGGGLGFLLLLLRIGVNESGMYKQLQNNQTHISKGNFFSLFKTKERATRYLLSILIGLPTWYVIGILLTFSNDFAKIFNIQGKIDPSRSVMFAYVAISIADILIGLLSLALKSRKKALYIFYALTVGGIIYFFTGLYGASTNAFYACCAFLGFGTGFWALFVTIGAEQFGTNLRATAATTIPNMVRGLLAFMILPMFKFFRGETIFNDYLSGAIVTGIIILSISIIAVYFIKETYGKELDFIEE